jgi:hypothetical protein
VLHPCVALPQNVKKKDFFKKNGNTPPPKKKTTTNVLSLYSVFFRCGILFHTKFWKETNRLCFFCQVMLLLLLLLLGSNINKVSTNSKAILEKSNLTRSRLGEKVKGSLQDRGLPLTTQLVLWNQIE